MLMSTKPTWEEIAKAALEEAAREDARRGVRYGSGDAGNKAWHIVRAVGKSDLQVQERLHDLHIEFYYPQVLEMRKVPRRQLSASQRRSNVEIKRPQPSPMFPKYIFVHFDMERGGWRDLFRHAGVGGMVCHGDLPVWVPDTLISSIKGRENNGLVPGTVATRVVFNVGDMVTVTSGPFASFPAVVERGLDVAIEDLDPEDRISVAISIFGRATPAELEVWQVAKH
ncbi:transcription termination/antitermination protein NusG [Pseudorhodoplanes sinuspersici]|uniref:Transcription termination/antitermination protein NusG n=1 Tax=Pseudorhodoplanes sinuspersici TaxID=1235591 RepID=A0A1W6ZX57_9HYPH|nr:transcription termination/antitermination protein NusG [Pseudorhodoplanes sinuspersici]ARQ01896.1 hypothetical protein CAK95_24455 [Pseudorhodoplanes sinuspersici]RKE73662.1 transcriptional antiterminator NusG [Pseudorhodoplanes sinuspersici]